MIKTLYSIYNQVCRWIYIRWSHYATVFYFHINNVTRDNFTSIGVPLLDIHQDGKCEFGAGLVIVNNAKFATLGKSNRCKFVVSSGAKLLIGNKVAMSNTTIVATLSVTLGNNILLGGGVTIVDTDFHSLNPAHWHTIADYDYMQKSPVVIKDNVFIGMNAVILKGVTIGSNVIIGAGSVISKDIPDNQMWGGNPARFIKNCIIRN
jgi:acetyltransferase-like isoleucine patch superfamily enzyme